MWNDDGDWRTYKTSDEQAWDDFRQLRTDSVASVIELLIDLRVITSSKAWDQYYGFDIEGFTTRNWKV